jgi:hypothetical protein
MTTQLWANNATSKIAAAVAAIDTSLTFTLADDALFPNPTGAQYLLCTLTMVDGSYEIIKVTTHTATSGAFQVIERAQEGTAALAITAGDVTDGVKLELILTADSVEQFARKDEDNTFVGDNTHSGNDTHNGNSIHNGNVAFNKVLTFGSSTEVSTAHSMQLAAGDNFVYHISPGTAYIFKSAALGSAADRVTVYESGGITLHDTSGNAPDGGQISGAGNAIAGWYHNGSLVYSSASMFEYVGAIVDANANAHPHGLGSRPTLTQFLIRCVDAGGEHGYAQNDEVSFTAKRVGIDEWSPPGWCDATNVGVVTNNEIAVMSKTSFANAVCTNSKWNFVMRAWK